MREAFWLVHEGLYLADEVPDLIDHVPTLVHEGLRLVDEVSHLTTRFGTSFTR